MTGRDRLYEILQCSNEEKIIRFLNNRVVKVGDNSLYTFRISRVVLLFNNFET